VKTLIILGVCLSFITNAATFNVTVSNFKFTPNNLEIEVGDTVIWTNNDGFHDVIADNESFTSGPASSSFVFQRTFNSVEEILYYCSIHSRPGFDINLFMNGRINVVMPQVEPEPTFEINQGISGSWFFPETTGSGFLIDVRPVDQFIFAAWFTHDFTDTDRPANDTGARWYTIAGNYEGNSAVLDIFETSGGLFDSSQQVSTIPVGTFTFEFNSCGSGNVSYEFTEDPAVSGTFPIEKAVPGNEELCESLEIESSTNQESP